MILGKVIGSLWSTAKDESLIGAKLLIVSRLNLEMKELTEFLVAVDNVGAGVGDIVLVAAGSSVLHTAMTTNKPIDAVIMAIVDGLDIPALRLRSVTGNDSVTEHSSESGQD